MGLETPFSDTYSNSKQKQNIEKVSCLKLRCCCLSRLKSSNMLKWLKSVLTHFYQSNLKGHSCFITLRYQVRSHLIKFTIALDECYFQFSVRDLFELVDWHMVPNVLSLSNNFNSKQPLKVIGNNNNRIEALFPNSAHFINGHHR